MLSRAAALTAMGRLQRATAARPTACRYAVGAAPLGGAAASTPAAAPPTPPPRQHQPTAPAALLLPPPLLDALASLFARRPRAQVVALGSAAPLAVGLAARGLSVQDAEAAAVGSADLAVVVSSSSSSKQQQQQQPPPPPQKQLLREARRLLRRDGAGYLAVARLELDEASPFSRGLLALLRAHGAGREETSPSSLECAAAEAVAACAAADGGPASASGAGAASATLLSSSSPSASCAAAAAAASACFDAVAADGGFEPRSHASYACPVELRGGASALAHALGGLLLGADEDEDVDGRSRRHALAADLRELAHEHGASVMVGGSALRVDLRARLAVMRRTADAEVERRRRYDDW
jgi:hypothetical protein